MLCRGEPLSILLFSPKTRSIVLFRPDFEKELGIIRWRDNPETPLVIDDIGRPTKESLPIVPELLSEDIFPVQPHDSFQPCPRISVRCLSEECDDVGFVGTIIDILGASGADNLVDILYGRIVYRKELNYAG